jgi:stearoyl-CoA desaturase (delta-9 desaturase)
MKKQGVYNWKMVFFLTVIPIIGIFGTALYIYYNGIVWQELLLLLTFWFLSGMGITMGYHRLFAHSSYKTNIFVEWVLMILGSMAFENTILKWASDHRTHHSKAETKDDPYSITEGFWHAHIGWILKNTPEEKSKVRGVKDLQEKSAIKFQNKYYFYIGGVIGFGIPLAIGFLYNRPLGALLWGGFLRVTLVHHATFFINSLCHYVGRRPYNFDSTARDSWFVSLFTFGEGYHNYHHTFQWDYRNGIKWFAFDPSKWIINILSFAGITHDLKTAQDYLIWKNNLGSIKSQLNEIYNQSTEHCRLFYNNKINQLQKNTDQILLTWQDMESKYTKISRDTVHPNGVLKQVRDNRKKYKSQLKLIKRDLTNIMFNIKRDRLSPKLI